MNDDGVGYSYDGGLVVVTILICSFVSAMVAGFIGFFLGWLVWG